MFNKKNMLKKTINRKGLKILSKYNPQLPSFAMSFTLKSGSRAEKKKECGIYHFIEHMIFKGSKNYNFKEIAEISDRLGGSLNAYTGKETTQYHIKSIDEKIKETFSLLSDMVMNSIFPEEEFLKEKNVIIQEIKESIDNPDSHIFELFYENLFIESPLGFPILGTEESIRKLSKDYVFNYYKKKYIPENLILSVSGNIKHEDLIKMVDEKFRNYPNSKKNDLKFEKTNFNFASIAKKRELKQLYVLTGFRGIPSNSPLRYSFMIANDILGSGMSSRLFQRIREEKGLAYTINSFPDSFFEDGILMIYSIIESDKLNDYLDAIKEELLSLKRNGITEKELERSKDHIKSSVILGLESNTTMMQFIVNQELYSNESMEIKEIIEEIRNLKTDDINNIFSSLLDFDTYSILCYGSIHPIVKPIF